MKNKEKFCHGKTGQPKIRVMKSSTITAPRVTKSLQKTATRVMKNAKNVQPCIKKRTFSRSLRFDGVFFSVLFFLNSGKTENPTRIPVPPLPSFGKHRHGNRIKPGDKTQR